MTDYADLELGLFQRDRASWRVELRFSQPFTDADTRLETSGPMVANLDPGEFRELLDDPDEYGAALGRALLANDLGAAYRQAIATSQSQGVTLRVRLLVGPNAGRLNRLRWETMRDPIDGSPLLTDENIVFSRYLSSMDWRPVGLMPKAGLRALVMVAGPSDLGEFEVGRPLDPIDVEAEVQRAREELTPIPTTVLAGRGKATLDCLFDSLRDGCDVLYLVCHGYEHADDPIMLLEDPDGRAAPVRGSALVERIYSVKARPPPPVPISMPNIRFSSRDNSSGRIFASSSAHRRGSQCERHRPGHVLAVFWIQLGFPVKILDKRSDLYRRL